MCDIGAAGRQSDGGIFRNSEFGKKFYSERLLYVMFVLHLLIFITLKLNYLSI